MLSLRLGNEGTSVEGGQEGVDVELGQRKVEDEVKRGGRGTEENQVRNSKDGSSHTSLDGTADQARDDIVRGRETRSGLLQCPDERSCDDDVGNGSACEPKNDDDLELLEESEALDDFDTDGGANGGQEGHDTEEEDDTWNDPRVHQAVDSPGEEGLACQCNDRSQDRVRCEHFVGPRSCT